LIVEEMHLAVDVELPPAGHVLEAETAAHVDLVVGISGTVQVNAPEALPKMTMMILHLEVVEMRK
jgi:hypothetical protein